MASLTFILMSASYFFLLALYLKIRVDVHFLEGEKTEKRKKTDKGVSWPPDDLKGIRSTHAHRRHASSFCTARRRPLPTTLRVVQGVTRTTTTVRATTKNL